MSIKYKQGRALVIMSEKRSFFLRMKDGVRLHCVYYPGKGRRLRDGLPVFLLRCDEDGGSLRFAEQLSGFGFGVLVEHVRGQGESEGEFVPFVNEISDGMETLVQLERERGFSKSRFILCGEGYGGYCAVAMLASERWRQIDAIAVSSCSASLYHHWCCNNGVLAQEMFRRILKWGNADAGDCLQEMKECWGWSPWISPLRHAPALESWLVKCLHSHGQCGIWKQPWACLWPALEKLPGKLRVLLHAERGVDAGGIVDMFHRIRENVLEQSPRLFVDCKEKWNAALAASFCNAEIMGMTDDKMPFPRYLICENSHLFNNIPENRFFFLETRRLAENPSLCENGVSDFVASFVNTEDADTELLPEKIVRKGNSALFVSSPMSALIQCGGTPRIRIGCVVNATDLQLSVSLVVFSRDGRGREMARGAIHLCTVKRLVPLLSEQHDALRRNAEVLDVKMELSPVAMQVMEGERLALWIRGAGPPDWVPAGACKSEENDMEACYEETAQGSLLMKRTTVAILHNRHCRSYVCLPVIQ